MPVNATSYTGAMIALVPTETDAKRLAVEGGLPADQLHATLVFLGDDASEISPAQRLNLIEAAIRVARDIGELRGDGFAIDVFNPDGDHPCIVVGLGGEGLQQAHDLLVAEVAPNIPDQKKPWIPHITLTYTDDFDQVADLVDRVGSVTFDRIRVAFAGEHTDIRLARDADSFPDMITAAVNATGWKKLPIAERDTKFAFRAAVDRLAAKASTIEQFSSWFFWRDPSKAANNRNSYRMPFADVFDDGTVMLVPAAVFSAAAQLSGAHGLLSIPHDEREQIMRTIDQIYDLFRNQWDDPRQVPPWERTSNSVADEPVKAAVGEEENMPITLVDDEDDELTAAVRSGGWSSLPTSTGEWDEGAARQALDSWAGDDMGKYAKGFLWTDGSGNKTGFKFPIAKPVDGKLTIFIRAVNNADARLSSSNIPAADKAKIQGILDSIQRRYQGSEGDSVTAAAPVRAPASWYENPLLAGPTKLRVTEEGRVYGHLAQWNTCHRGVGNSCLLAPRSIVDYAHFKTGTTMTADGMLRPVGNLTYGGGHADTNLGYIAAAAHYDEAGTTVASVNVGEDAHGIWVAGSMAPGTGEVEAQQLRSHPLSGDWRRTGGNLELIAALAVNTPGFPIEEPQYSVTASGDQMSLIAAGVVLEDGTVAEEDAETVTADAADTEPETDLAKTAERIEALKANADALKARDWQRRSRRIIDIQLPDRS